MPAGARARSVICRRLKAGGEMVFVSDARSDKNDELRDHPGAEVVFWLAGARMQYRVAGEVAVVRAGLVDALHQQVWRELSDATRAMFFWPPGGEPYEATATFEQAVPADIGPPATFELLVLRPTMVDVLDLRRRPHERRIIEATASGWIERRVNP